MSLQLGASIMPPVSNDGVLRVVHDVETNAAILERVLQQIARIADSIAVSCDQMCTAMKGMDARQNQTDRAIAGLTDAVDALSTLVDTLEMPDINLTPTLPAPQVEVQLNPAPTHKIARFIRDTNNVVTGAEITEQ